MSISCGRITKEMSAIQPSNSPPLLETPSSSSSINSLDEEEENLEDYAMELTLLWANISNSSKQTVFPIYGQLEDKKKVTKRGMPTGNYCAIRVTKGVNMNPPFALGIWNMKNPKKPIPDDEVRLSLVNAIDKLPPPKGILFYF